MNPSTPALQHSAPLGYKAALGQAMRDLAADPLVCFVGYGVRYGGQAAGTLKGIPPDQLIETPVAENLMVSMAIGLALAGRRPVVFIERMDFILNALDAIVNHLDKASRMSHGTFAPAVIIRAVVGNQSKPLFTGATHTQDFTAALRDMVSFPVIKLFNAEAVRIQYPRALERMGGGQQPHGAHRSTLLVELKDQY